MPPTPRNAEIRNSFPHKTFGAHHVMEYILDQADGSGSGHTTDTELETPSPSPPQGGSFRINSGRVLLTYPHYNEAPAIVLELLNAIKPIRRGIACLELHQDGEPHVHAAVEFATKVNSVNRRIFDLEGHHPNIQSKVRSWGACVNYCRKEGTLEVAVFGAASADDLVRVAGGTLPSQESTGDVFGVAERAETERQWIQFCIDNRISSTYCVLIWQHVRGSHAPTLRENEALPAAVTNIQLRGLEWTDDVRTLVVCGPSGIGKTSWARAQAPVPSLIVTDIDDLKSYDANYHRSIIFDEIRCNGARDHNGRWVGAWPLTAQIKLVTWDHPVSIRIRYTLARLPAHVPKIFTCTDTICFTFDEQVNRRIQILNLYTDRTIEALWDV